jgi:peptide-methionine (S)-S-oxide reductase
MSRALLSLVLTFAVASIALAQSAIQPGKRAVATFAGGCFWCTEADFDKVPGVISTTSGYIGGRVANPTYAQVSAGNTGHAEAVEIAYDPGQVTFEQLLAYYWRHVDPTVKNRQFCDVGEQYRTAIFVHDDEQRKLAEASRKKIEVELEQPVYTQIATAGPFYKAEDYHQDFYQKNPVKYKFYRWNCGRDQRLEQLWGDRKGDS